MKLAKACSKEAEVSKLSREYLEEQPRKSLCLGQWGQEL